VYRHAEPIVTIVIVGWRAAPYLPECLQSIGGIDRTIDFEVVIALNEPSSGLPAAMSGDGFSTRVISSPGNRGFGGAANAAAAASDGKYLVFLSQGAQVDRHWLRELVETAERGPQIGAVGSFIFDADGRCREAGSFVWSDGSSSPASGNGAEFPHRYDWARRVDCCSATSLLVKRSTWDEVGGFDESYFPAYGEDVDLCLRIGAIGQQVWFQPLSIVHHAGPTCTSIPYRRFLRGRGREVLSVRWPQVLEQRVRRSNDQVGDEETASWLAMGRPQRILVIDDRIPESSLGAGFGRMVDALSDLTSSGGYFVSLFPTQVPEGDRTAMSRRGVRVLHGDLEAHLRHPVTTYDLVMISRPHNYEQIGGLVRECQPRAAILYDAEALFFRRIEQLAELTSDQSRKEDLLAKAATMRQAEEGCFVDADQAVCISDAEADIARAFPGAAPVHVVPPHLVDPVYTTRPFDQRRDIILVASWLAGTESPNVDGLDWFVREVLPLIREEVPWVRVRITGADPPAEVMRYQSPNVRFEGRVDDLADLYDRSRVVIVPVRYGAGVKIKTIEALQFGVPTVATSTGAEGIETLGTSALSVIDDPVQFADRVASLVDDRRAWEAQRNEIAELLHIWSKDGGATTWRDVVERAIRDRLRSPVGVGMQRRLGNEQSDGDH
jgi:O-antigen biosynthesis protein